MLPHRYIYIAAPLGSYMGHEESAPSPPRRPHHCPVQLRAIIRRCFRPSPDPSWTQLDPEKWRCDFFEGDDYPLPMDLMKHGEYPIGRVSEVPLNPLEEHDETMDSPHG